MNNGPDLCKFFSRLSYKSTQASTRVRDLFNDGAYLYDAVKVALDHHWVNMNTKNKKGDLEIFPHYGSYSDKTTRWELYTDALRNVLRRSIFGFYMWDTVRVKIGALSGAFETHRRENLVKHQEIPDGVHKRLFRVIAKPNYAPPELHENVWELQRSIQVLVRYYAIFFWNEFRNKSIHASWSNVRKFFHVTGADPAQRDLPREHYGDHARIVDFDVFEGIKPDEEAGVHFAEVVNTFLGDRTASMHVGIRKVTEYLQTLVDKSPPKPCTPFVGETVDCLGLLATIADTLDLHWPTMIDEGKKSSEVRENMFRAAASPYSIDLLHFDDFPIEQYIEQKRLYRIYTWFDEMQGFHDDPEAPLRLGRAKGASRRLDFSLMRKFIRPKNQQAVYKANNQALYRLEDSMELEWEHQELPCSTSHDDEQPWNAEPNTKRQRKANRAQDYRERLKVYKAREKAYVKRRAGNIGKKANEREPWRKARDIGLKACKNSHKRKLERRERQNAKRLKRIRENEVGELASAEIYGSAEQGLLDEDGCEEVEENIQDDTEQLKEGNDTVRDGTEETNEDPGEADAKNPQDNDQDVDVDNQAPEQEGSLWDDMTSNQSIPAPWTPPKTPWSPWSEGWESKWAVFGNWPDGTTLEYHRCLEWDIAPNTGQYISSHVDSVTGNVIAHPYLDYVPSTADVGNRQAQPLHIQAPDGQPKRVIKEKAVWDTMETIFGVQRETNESRRKAHVSVSWKDIVKLMRALGYESIPGKAVGSHWKFERRDRCRWPSNTRLPGAADISMHRPTGGDAAAQNPGVVNDFGRSLTEQGLSYFM